MYIIYNGELLNFQVFEMVPLLRFFSHFYYVVLLLLSMEFNMQLNMIVILKNTRNYVGAPRSLFQTNASSN